MFEWIADPQAWVTLATLTFLEIVLGIDNIIFLTILVNKVDAAYRQRTRLFGLALAMVTRVILLLSLTWVMRLTEPLFSVFEHAISGRDLILIGGGLFLIWKSLHEIFDDADHSSPSADDNKTGVAKASFVSIILQIAVIDIVFSLDSVITAVGLSDIVSVMVIAIMISVFVMMFAAKTIGDFVDAHPSIKTLALAFLVMIGVVLVADGFDIHIPKPYIYVSMAFSLTVEMLNIRRRKLTQKIASQE